MTSSTPPPRRRPLPVQPVRRPRVAGLRRPETPAQQPNRRSDADDRSDEQTQVIPKIPAEPVDATAPPAPKPAPRQKRRATVESKPTTLEQAPRRRPRPSPNATDSTDTATATDTPAGVDTAVASDAFDGRAFDATPADSAADSLAATSFDSGADVDAAPRRRRMVLPLILAVVTIVVGGLAAWFAVEWVNVRSSAAAANTALTDAATTSQINGEITTAVNEAFSFDYTNLGKTRREVQQVLTGGALCQYNELFNQVEQQAPSQKLVLTTTVQDKGVELLQGNTARVLLLVEQHDTRATTNQTSDSQSMIAVNAVKLGGTWKISAIDTFSGTNPTAGC